MRAVTEQKTYKFDRYRNGKPMAQGATIRRAVDEKDALKKAKALFGNHPFERFVLKTS